MNEKRTIAEPSAEARLLYTHLLTTKEGDVLTFEAIKAACGVDVRRFRGALTTARRWLLAAPDPSAEWEYHDMRQANPTGFALQFGEQRLA